MIKLINLEFFKGGSTTEKVEKRDPKSPQQLAMDSSVYNLISPIAARYGGTSVLPNITTTKITQPEPGIIIITVVVKCSGDKWWVELSGKITSGLRTRQNPVSTTDYNYTKPNAPILQGLMNHSLARTLT